MCRHARRLPGHLVCGGGSLGFPRVSISIRLALGPRVDVVLRLADKRRVSSASRLALLPRVSCVGRLANVVGVSVYFRHLEHIRLAAVDRVSWFFRRAMGARVTEHIRHALRARLTFGERLASIHRVSYPHAARFNVGAAFPLGVAGSRWQSWQPNRPAATRRAPSAIVRTRRRSASHQRRPQSRSVHRAARTASCRISRKDNASSPPHSAAACRP